MISWIGFLIAFIAVAVVVIVAARSRSAGPGMRHIALKRRGRQSAVPHDPPAAAVPSSQALRKEPNIEYRGEMFFFCSIEERDSFTAHLQQGDYHPEASMAAPRAIERRQ